MRNNPPEQPLNYGDSVDLPSPCLPSLGSQTSKTKLYVESNSAVPSQGANDNQPTARNDTHTPVSSNKSTPGNPEDKSNSAMFRVRKMIIHRSLTTSADTDDHSFRKPTVLGHFGYLLTITKFHFP
ncbi:hypothetical protein RHMOL_Rhmol01G0185600 [Rhododendron molle]|uniref:Uncharacterized protein n=1 Tax=Rhododendron molle TaxID=49168 RepID=A0ACC0Q374_RHOML|nr:hypothetical protein RHMOL_Rhmol01G0185600 [Rhododendron molle]